MIRKELTVTNQLGLHARAAAKLVRVALSFQSEVWLAPVDCNVRIDAKSILSLMQLGASRGTQVQCHISGPDEVQALEAIEMLFESNFGESA